MQAGERFYAVVWNTGQIGGVCLQKSQPGKIGLQRTNVDDCHSHEGQKVSHKAVDTGTDVEMGGRLCSINLACRPQILVKVMPRRTPRRV